ncbi:MAG: 2-oxoglutarate and iron-dependent oxygenase domain-containing protein, partial [Ilumatobacteraceae bacterium]
MDTPPIVDITDLRRIAIGPPSESDIRLADHPEAIAIHAACLETGFFVVTGHGIDDEISVLFRAARRFFELPSV